MKNDNQRVLGGVLLVTGTTIGAAMLALPVSTGLAGFFPVELLFVLCWIYMTYTAFLILEVNLWMGENSNMITMARRTLGNSGAAFAWASYLFLLYSLLTAYVAVSGRLFEEFTEALLHISIPAWLGPLPLLAVFSYFVYRGTHAADLFNRVLMIGMAIAYAVLMGLLAPHLDTAQLTHVDWKYTLLGVSVLTVSFGFHIIIPTLTTYLKSDVGQLKRVILIGSALPLAIYTLWQALALGTLPLPLIEIAYTNGTNGAAALTQLLNSPWVHVTARAFVFFAVVTSFLGVSLSLWDCLADGLKVSPGKRGRLLLYTLTFVPPLIFALTSERAFLTALEYAGAFGVVVLLALLPACMVWAGRYRLHLPKSTTARFQTPGGKVALVAVILLSLGIIIVELLNQSGITQQLLF